MVAPMALVMWSYPGATSVTTGPRTWNGAARDDAGDPVGREREVLPEDAGVDGEVVDALPRLVLDRLEVDLDREVLGVSDARERLVDRNGAERDGHLFENRLADLANHVPGREVHDRVGPELLGEPHLGDLV